VTEVFVNPAHRAVAPRPVAPHGGRGPRAFHRRLPGYEPTPLHTLPGRASDLGLGSLWVKDETSRMGMPSFKVLGASWATYRALCARLGAEPEWASIGELRAAVAPLGPLTLVAATDGNHGRAVALMARLLGASARILVPSGTAEARVAGIEEEGAVVSVVDGTYDDAVTASAALAAPDALVISDTSWDGYTEIPGWVIEGYSTIFAEVDEQLNGAAVDVVVVQVGVGALAASAVQRYAGSASLVAVEPLGAACALRSAQAGRPTEVPGPHTSIMAGLNCGRVSAIAWPVVAAGVEVFMAVEDVAAEAAMIDLAAAGIDAGETGAAGLAGLRALAAAGVPVDLTGRSVLALCTEGPTDPVSFERIVGRPPTR